MFVGHPYSEIDEEHRYAIGFFLLGDNVGLLRSYQTEESLKRDFKKSYVMAIEKNIEKPIPLTKNDPNISWEERNVLILTGLTKEILSEMGLLKFDLSRLA